MSNQDELCIVGIGARTSIGTDASMSGSVAALGYSRFSLHPELEIEEGVPIKYAPVPYLEEDALPKWMGLILPAIDEAMESAQQVIETQKLKFICALPESNSVLVSSIREEVKKTIKNHLKLKSPNCQFEFISEGNTSILLALKSSQKDHSMEDDTLVLIGGVDSLTTPENLTLLRNQNRLTGGALKRGIIPGEASGFIMITTKNTAHKCQLPEIAIIHSVEISEEPHPDDSSEVCTGEGLSKAFKGALQRLPEGQKAGQIFCDLNGENHRVEEYGFSITRFQHQLDDATDYFALPGAFGDIGTATGALLINQAICHADAGLSSNPWNLIFTSNLKEKERAAALIEIPV